MTEPTPPPSEPNDTKAGWTPEGLRAWGRALVKTGTEQLDLPMVRQGKRTLAEAEAPPPKVPPKP